MNQVVESAADPRRAQRLAYAYAGVAGVMMAIFLLRMPIQLTDSFTEFLIMQGRSPWDVIRPEFLGGPYVRPLRRGVIKIVFELSRGQYYWWFRGLHAVQLIVLFLLVVRILRVRSIADAAVIPLTIATIAGSQTFADVVREAFPINHFLTILLCCAGAVSLAQSRGGKVVDATAVVLVAFSILTIESGLLVWVVLVAAYAVGWRGVSRGALAACTLVFVSYFLLRYSIGQGGLPGIDERSTGFGFSAADPEALKRAFGDRLWPFYIYNVVSAICCVLFAEPRGGIWLFTRAVVRGGLLPWQVLTVATSTLTTLVIGWSVAQRAQRWRRFELDDGDRLTILFLVLLPANAMFAAVYEKDVILSPAGLFYAIAAAVACRRLLFEEPSRLSLQARRVLVYAVVAALATGWTVRSVGIHYRLRQVARTDRNEWAYVSKWEAQQGIHLTDAGRGIEQVLYDDAIWRMPSPPVVTSRLADRLFDPVQ
jgi:hypothetical protein